LERCTHTSDLVTNSINSVVQKRCFALFLHDGYANARSIF